MKKIVIIGLLSSLTACVNLTDSQYHWQDIGVSTDNRFRHAVALSSKTKQNNNMVTFIGKTTKLANTNSAQEKLNYQYIITKWQIDCSKRLFKAVEVEFFNQSNESIAKHQGAVNFKPIGKGSVAEKQLNLMCTGH